MAIYVKEMYKEANSGLSKTLWLELYNLAYQTLVKRGETKDLEQVAVKIVDTIVNNEGILLTVYEEGKLLSCSFFTYEDTVHWGEVWVELNTANVGSREVTKEFVKHRNSLIKALGGRYIRTRYKDGGYFTQEITLCHS